MSSSSASSDLLKRWWKGLVLVLLATLCLSLQNVIARIAQSSQPLHLLGGLLELGGYVNPKSDKIQVSLLVLFLRISFVLPILWVMLIAFRRQTVSEVRQILGGGDRSLKIRIFAAGFFLFLSQTSIYFSLANIGPASAVTIFFIYPTVTTLLAWKLFGDRPSLPQWAAIALIYLGCTWLTFAPVFPTGFPQTAAAMAATPKPVLVSPAASKATPVPHATVTPKLSPKVTPIPSASPPSSPSLVAPSPTPSPAATPPSISAAVRAIGVVAALMSGVVFAMEGVIAQSCFAQVNPATFTGMIFSVEWIFLALVHISSGWLFPKELPINDGLVLMGVLLSLATLAGYLFNNFGIQAIGAASTAIIGSSGPVVTAILVLLIISNPLDSDRLIPEKWFAIFLVTIGVVVMNLAKARAKPNQLTPEE
jgi:drug/metabolite transporter (DMT)-like permease